MNTHRESAREKRYLVGAVTRACRLLTVFEHPDEVLRLKDLAERAELTNATAFRLLLTLEKSGFVERVGKNCYRSRITRRSTHRYRFGYATAGEDPSFVQEWTASIVEACAAEAVELLIYDNGDSSETALANVGRMIADRVDLAIEHLMDEAVAKIIGPRLAQAGIPLIAMGAAHPSAIYFGGDNFHAGAMAGRWLGQWAQQHWGTQAQQLLLLELESGGPLLQSRLRGVECGLKEALPQFDLAQVVRVTGNGQFGSTMQAVRKHLSRTRARRILVGAVNDPSALGALRALEESGWAEDCAVVGHGGSAVGREELRRRGTRLIGTVAFFPEKYGQHIVGIGLSLLRGHPVPPAVFTNHALLTPANVDSFYPNDRLLGHRPVRLT